MAVVCGGGWSCSSLPSPVLCLLSQHCWFRGVSLRDGGGGAVAWWRSGVVVWRCGRAVWKGGGVRCLVFVHRSLSSFLFLFVFVVVFGVVRAQPCEHARYPRTPLCFSCCFACLVFSSLLSPAFLRVLSFFCWNGGGGFHHVSEHCVGMTATGSLSRSSSFFW